MDDSLKILLLDSLCRGAPPVGSLLDRLAQIPITDRMMTKLELERFWGTFGADPADEMAVYSALSEGVGSSGCIRVGGEAVTMNAGEHLLAQVGRLDRLDYLGMEGLTDPGSGRVTFRTLGYSDALTTGTTPQRGDLVFVLRPTEAEPSEVLVALGGDQAIGCRGEGAVTARVRLSSLAAEGHRLRYGAPAWRRVSHRPRPPGASPAPIR